jgi:hypothetical protein
MISRTYAAIGDFAKALQYAKEAVKDRPTDPALRGNYGVMFYHNFLYADSAKQLGLAVNGGQTEDGFPIKGLPLANELRVVEYYYTYGSALARTNQCGKALQVVQDIQTNVHMDEVAMEGVNVANSKIIEICQENLDNPAVDTHVPTSEGTTGEESPEPVETSTP